jgi:hypothetical protein
LAVFRTRIYPMVEVSPVKGKTLLFPAFDVEERAEAVLGYRSHACLVASILLAFLIFPSILTPPPPTSVSLLKAGDGSYATGSSLSGSFAFQRAVVVTGAFVTNATVTVRIQQSSYPTDADECQVSAPTLNCYTTGNVSHAILNVTLQQGNYRLIVTFTNDTAVQTWFNVTQGFVATLQK